MSQTIRVGIIGAVSSYSLHYGQALVELPNVEFVGMAYLERDPKYIRDALNLPWLAKYPKTVEGYAEAFGPVYATAEELIEKGKPDALCICTEDYLREKYALLTIENGLHVFLPKPFAKSREEAKRIFGAANEKGVVAIPDLPQRFRPLWATAMDMVDEGVIGRPISGHFAIAHHLTLGGWKSDTSMAAGPELEVGFYVFDSMRMLMQSDPVKVMGVGDNLDHRGIPYIDNGKCVITCENGAMASVDLVVSMHHPFPPARSSYVIGDEGALAITGNEIAVHTADGVESREVPEWSHTQ
ncbi:MAG: Gfo/Idh/MocA family oxidoreductase, partial [Candidatus Latescibacteria bacterium]|nr:Gfo/Idh/MocA family oxidoreductase [Candidatus Latescibacterota bacterium]